MQLQRLYPCFRGPAIQWEWLRCCTTKRRETGSVKSMMAACKLEIRSSQLVNKIATYFQRLCLCFQGTAIHGVIAMLIDHTGRNRKLKIQVGGMLTWSSFISACIQDSNAISTAIPMFWGSSYPMGVIAMLYDRAERNRKWKNLKWRHVNFKYVYHSLYTR